MSKNRILVVDDDEALLRLCGLILGQLADAELALEIQSRRAAERLKSESFDLLIADICTPEMSGLDLVRVARQADPQLGIVLITGFPSVETAVQGMKLGAADYIIKPFAPEHLLNTARLQLESRRLRDENRLLRRQVERGYCCGEILGQSAPMQEVCDKIQRTAEIDYDVLIVGETGTGKELVARAIHRRGRRREGPFVPVNCGAIPEELMEREFFGHERGAFTGALARSMGLLEYADGGTLFLDELNQLATRLQGKLLRVLQERRLRRVGGNKEIDFSVRVVAASSVPLEEEVRQGRFRADLYHRVNVVRINLPPLRERAGDVPLLAKSFLDHFGRELDRGPMEVSPEAMEVLCSYSWPGNVRELQNVVKRALAWARSSVISIEDLPEEVVARGGDSHQGTVGSFFTMREHRVNSFEKDYFAGLLRDFQGDASAAAREANLPRGTLYRLLKKYGLNPAKYRGAKMEEGPL